MNLNNLYESPFKFSMYQLSEIYTKNDINLNIHGHLHEKSRPFK